MKTKLVVVTIATLFALPGGPVTTPDTAEASFPGANGKVVFDLYCVDDTECESSDNGIFEVTDEGIERLTSDPSDQSPAWSSDGEWLAFSRCDDTDCDIWIARSDGSDEQFITSDETTYEADPSWSPDGNKLVYSSCPTLGGSNSCELWVADLVAGEAIMLTDNSRLEQNPAWSPNGKWIVFEAGRCQTSRPLITWCIYKNPGQIYRIKPEQGEVATKLTRLDEGALDPNYSPGGKRIVFNDSGGRLFTISPRGTGLRKFGLANSDGINDADYSPDAGFFIMTVYIGDEAGIYTWNLENDETEELFGHPYLWPDSPAWQPVP